MSEPIDPSTASTESFIDEYPASTPTIDKSRALSHGLPPTYRMRHDAHDVDELESKRRQPTLPHLGLRSRQAFRLRSR